MDLVKIGFLIQTSGLEKANKEVDSLLDKTGKIGTVSKKSATEVEASQKKAKKATEETTKAVDKNTKAVEKGNKEADKAKKAAERTTQALEKQKIVGEYLAKGLDKSTANSLANFRQLKASVIDTNTMFTLLGDNSALNKANKQTRAINDSLNKMKLNLDLVGKGFSASEQAQIRQLKANGASNAELEKAIELIKKRKQAEVLADYQNEKASLSREWMSAYDKEIEARVAKEKEAAAKIQQVRDTVSDYEARSKRSFGGGILDQVEAENKEILALRKKYTDEINAIADKEAAEEEARRVKTMQARQKEYQQSMELLERERNKFKQANAEREKALLIEEKRSKYVEQGFGKGDAKKLATLDVAGVDPDYLERYKKSLAATTTALGSFGDAATKASASHSGLTSQIRGIAFYAVLSTAIYGAMTAMMNLASATVRMADEYTAIQNRMKLYIKDAGELGRVNAQLAQMSIENNVGLRETSTLFSRLLPAMQKIGANTAAVTSVVDAFGKSMRIGGATAMEAASATIQFSQAMASGKLAGDEFRSISEASPRFLQAIADGSGIAAEKLKEMSSAGMLTTEVISKALLKEYPKLIAENAKLGATLEQGSNAMKTAFTVMAGEFNEGAKATETVGTAMMGLASSMIKTAQSARQTGEDMRNWFADNADNINLLVSAFKVLTAVIASRYVAAIILARVESIRYQATLLSMAAAQTQATRTSTLLAAALSGVGNAAKGALAFFGGWVGLGLTVATTAASYFLLRDNTDAATIALAAQEGVVTKTTQELLKLSGAQKELEKQRMSEQFDVQKKGLEQLEQQIQAVIVAERARANFSDEMTTLLRGVKDGTISYSDALEQLNKQKGVDPKNVGTIETLIKQYNELAPKALQLAEGQRALGIDVDDVGNAAQNATPEVRNLANGYSDLEKAAFSASNRISALGKDIRNQIYQVRIARKLQQEEGLSSSSANMLSKSLIDQGQIVRSSGKVRDALEAENKLRAAIERDKKKGFDTTESELKLSKLVAQNQKTIADNLREYQKSHAGLLRQLDAENELGKEYNDIVKERDKEVNPFPEQAESLQRMIDLLNQGVEADVARIASQKEYVKWFGLSITQAEELANLEKQRAYLEAQAQARASYSQGLLDQSDELAVINDFLAEGVILEQAKVIAAAKYQANAVGYSMIVRNMVNELATQSDLLYEQVVYQEAINSKKAMGFSDERAALEYRIEKLREAALLSGKALSDEQENVIETVRNNLIASEHNKKRFDYESKIKDVKDQIANTLNFETLAMADIANSNKDLSKEAVRELAVRNEILESFRKQKELEQQKSENPFMDIDFSVFGDFGNPFQSALEGLNSLLFGMDNLAAKYEERKKYLSADVENAKKGTKEETEAKEALAQLEKNYITDVARMKEKRIEDGLKLTKLMFKEDSKGYKLMSALEMAYQAKSIAMEIKNFAIKKGLLAADTMAFQASTAKKILLDGAATAATVANNMIKATSSGIAALASSMAGLPFPLNIAAFAATGALLTSIGLNLVGGGKASGSFAPTNEGTGTVFGDPTAQSESIKKSIDLLAENSDVTLPLTAAMLKSLQNIENNIGGLANLLIRNAPASKLVEGVNVGFTQNSIGKGITKGFDAFNKMTFGLADTLTLGLFSSVGKALGGLFGKKVSVKGQGLYGGSQQLSDVLSDGFRLSEYVDIQTKKKTLGVTTSKKNSTQYSKASEELSNQFTLIFKGFNDAILAAAPMLDRSTNEVATKLNDYVIKIGKINLQGLNGEQIQEKLTAVFSAEADKMAQAAIGGLEDFQKVGEGYFETVMRVATSVEMATVYTDRLNVSAIKYTDVINKQGDITTEIIRQSVLLNEGNKNIKNGFYDLVNTFNGTAGEITDFVLTLRDLQDAIVATGKNGNYLTSAMFTGAGGLDRLQGGLESYFEILSPAEQAAELTRRITNEFAIFGEQVPNSVDAFKALVNGIDISTEAGQKLYGQVIALTPEFNDLQDALEAAKNEVAEITKEVMDFSSVIERFKMLGKGTKYLTEDLANAAGGLDKLGSGLDAYFSMLNPEDQMKELTRRMTNSFGELGLSLPKDTDGFKGLVASINISTKAGQELLGKLIALAPEFNTLQSSIKSVKEETERLAKEKQDLLESLLSLRYQFEMTGKNSKFLTMTIADAAGGIDKLSSGLDAYFDMLTPAEQAVELTRRMTDQFKQLGISLPNGTEGFRKLISGINVNTEAGKKLYGQVIALAPEFNTLQDALKSASSEVDDLVKSLRDLASEASKAAGETDQPRNLDYLRTMYDLTSYKAIMGDRDAAEKLLTLGQDLMSVSKEFSSSSEAYARDLAMIQRTATASADMIETTGGYSTNTGVIPISSASGSTPTVNTDTTSTDAKLEALRTDLNAALLAIAKYTQQTANKLDRWDSGDRMTVRIEQDVDDLPVKVEVV